MTIVSEYYTKHPYVQILVLECFLVRTFIIVSMLNKKGKKMTQQKIDEIRLDMKDLPEEFTDIVFKGMIQVIRNKNFDHYDLKTWNNGKTREQDFEESDIFVSMDEVNDFTNYFINSVGIELLESVQNTPKKGPSETTDFKGSGYSRMGVQKGNVL